MFSVRFRNPSKSLCIGNEHSVWVMCYRQERSGEAQDCSFPLEGAGPAPPQAALGTEMEFYTEFGSSLSAPAAQPGFGFVFVTSKSTLTLPLLRTDELN